MQKSNLPKLLAFWLLLSSSAPAGAAGASGAAAALEKIASCAAKYQPEFKQRFDLDEAGWEQYCQDPAPRRLSPGTKETARRDPAAAAAAAVAAAAGVDSALETKNFNGLYDRDRRMGGGADGGPAVLAGAGLKPAALPAPSGGQKPKPREPAAPREPPLDPKEVARHFKNQGTRQEEVFVKFAILELERSPEGRRIMRGIISDGIVVDILPTEFPGSPIVKNGNLEQINGTRGMAEPSKKLYRFNSNFMKMQDKSVALESVASNMGHELNHILLHDRIEKRFQKEGYSEVLKFALVDEQSARLKGYVVAYELNRGRPNGYIQEARSLLSEPDVYWESMKLWMPAYARALDLEEMKSPVPAYQARLQALTDKRDELDDEEPRLDAELRRIDHLGQAHGYAKALVNLRALFQTDKDTLPTRKKNNATSIKLVEERIKFLQTPQGKPLADKLKAAASDPKFTKLFADMQDDLKRLDAYDKSKPVPVPAPSPTPGQLGWKAFEKKWYQLHDDAPGHDPPWTEKP